MKVSIISMNMDVYPGNPRETRITADIKVDFPDGDFKELSGCITANHREKHDFHAAGLIIWSTPCFQNVSLSAKLLERIRDDFVVLATNFVFNKGKPTA